MGVPSASFFETYSAKVTDLMVNLVEYVQAMDNILNATPENGPFTGTGIGTGLIVKPHTHIHFDKTLNGFPILPNPILSDGWKKGPWDRLFSDYLGQIYHLACGGTFKHIPYKHISKNQKSFIDPKYLPPKTIFRSPRNIPLPEMKSLFNHFLIRQQSHGPEDTFKFKSIKFKGKTVSAQYKINVVVLPTSSQPDSSVPSPVLNPNRVPVPIPVPLPISIPGTMGVNRNTSNPNVPTSSQQDSSFPSQDTNSVPSRNINSVPSRDINSVPNYNTNTSPRKDGTVETQRRRRIPKGPSKTQSKNIVENVVTDDDNVERPRPRPRPRPITRSCNIVDNAITSNSQPSNGNGELTRPRPRPITRSINTLSRT